MRFPLLNVLFTQIILLILLYLMLFPKEGGAFSIVWIGASIIFLTYLPGLWLTYCFFPNDGISRFERFIMSFLLSVTGLVLFSYYLYYSGITPTHMKLYIGVFVLLIVSIFIALIRRRLLVSYEDDYELDQEFNSKINHETDENKLS